MVKSSPSAVVPVRTTSAVTPLWICVSSVAVTVTVPASSSTDTSPRVIVAGVATSSSVIVIVAVPLAATEPAGADTSVTVPRTSVNVSLPSMLMSSVIGMLMSTVSVASPPTKVAMPVRTLDGAKSSPAAAVPGTSVYWTVNPSATAWLTCSVTTALPPVTSSLTLIVGFTIETTAPVSLSMMLIVASPLPSGPPVASETSGSVPNPRDVNVMSTVSVPSIKASSMVITVMFLVEVPAVIVRLLLRAGKSALTPPSLAVPPGL